MKKMWLALLCVVVAGTSLTTYSADQKPSANGAAGKAQAAPKAKGMPFYGKVGAIDKAANTLTLDGKKKRIFYFTAPPVCVTPMILRASGGSADPAPK